MLKVAINGFGRIGRTALRLLLDDKDIEVVAINDLTDPLQLAYLYKYDSVHRTVKYRVDFDSDELIIKSKRIKVFAEPDPSKLPWKKLGVDIVLECTGVFTSAEKCQAHLDAGAKHVIISAPAKDEVKTIVYGVNHKILDKIMKEYKADKYVSIIWVANEEEKREYEKLIVEKDLQNKLLFLDYVYSLFHTIVLLLPAYLLLPLICLHLILFVLLFHYPLPLFPFSSCNLYHI